MGFGIKKFTFQVQKNGLQMINKSDRKTAE